MSVFDDFDRLLANFNDLEEPVFLNKIRHFAERHREVVIKTFTLLLKGHDLNIQLKYLVLKAIGELGDTEFIGVLREELKKEHRVQLVYETINSLTLMNSLPAYKIIVDFYLKNRDTEYAEKIEKILRVFFSKNPLTFHFDVFYRDRGGLNGIERSCDFLVQQLPKEYIQDLLPALGSRYAVIRFQVLRLLKARPDMLYYAAVYHFFLAHYQQADDDLFLLMSETLVLCAARSKARAQIFLKLKEMLPKFAGNKHALFSIALLELDTRHMMPHITGIYSTLTPERKMLVFAKLDREAFIYYMDFIRQLLDHETNEQILANIVEILVRSNDFQYLFQVVDSERGLRKEKLLHMILEHDPGDIDVYMRRYISPNLDNPMLRMALEYLLRHAADKYFDLIKSIFFSGVTADIKILIIRSVNRWNPVNQKMFMEMIFKDFSFIDSFKKDFLFALLGVMNEKVFNDDIEEQIVNRILVMMEEAALDELVNFIYFFDRYEIDREAVSQLIIEELRMVQNTVLKSSREDELVRMLHILIKKIERDIKLKNLE